jgi:cytochrome c oxidase cbb3-type subunit 3
MLRRRIRRLQGHVRKKTGGVEGARALSALLLALTLGLAGCTAEKRDIGPTAPASAPSGLGDRRQQFYETNIHELSEGGRLFRWFGCDQCHTETATGFTNLNDDHWRQGGATAQVYLSIANGAPGMPAYAGRVTPQQLWELSGYVHDLHTLKANVRQRSSQAQQGEPSGSTWTGPLR